MRLLFAEDEPSLSRAVTVLLEKNNYTVDPVYDGETALDYLKTGSYDGVILDVMMPKKDGISVLRELRAAGNPVPVLILSAKSEVSDKVLGLDCGANDYLGKPFAITELLARIRAMTRSASSQVTAQLHLGNLTLDQATFTLSSPYGSTTLANKEFQMLEMLMSHPRQVISADQFMSHIWGYDSQTDSGVVAVYVSYLRKKLASLQADVQIKVKRNLGYSLEDAG
jgi:DNA-binding response OmpR family regulator